MQSEEIQCHKCGEWVVDVCQNPRKHALTKHLNILFHCPITNCFREVRGNLATLQQHIVEDHGIYPKNMRSSIELNAYERELQRVRDENIAETRRCFPSYSMGAVIGRMNGLVCYFC